MSRRVYITKSEYLVIKKHIESLCSEQDKLVEEKLSDVTRLSDLEDTPENRELIEKYRYTDEQIVYWNRYLYEHTRTHKHYDSPIFPEDKHNADKA